MVLATHSDSDFTQEFTGDETGLKENQLTDFVPLKKVAKDVYLIPEHESDS